MKKNIIKLCPICKKEFQGRNNAWAIKRGYNRFCSRKCFAIFQRVRLITKCIHCDKKISVTPARLKDGRGKYCSKSCQYNDKKGTKPWNKGLKIGKKPAHSILMKKKYQNGKLNHLNNNKFKTGHVPWIKGKSFGLSNWLSLNGTHDYRNIHKRIIKKFGQPLLCEYCNNNNLEKYLYHWANISNKYLEIREDWLRLCYKCHAKYDSEKREHKQMMEILK